MSLALINRSADLKKLLDEGYELEVYKTYLLIHRVPYVNSEKRVAYGTLVSPLEISGDSTVKPQDHVVKWVGGFPCDHNGTQLTNLVNGNIQETIREGLIAAYTFSQKPDANGYSDYYQKMTKYILMLEGDARVITPGVTAKTGALVKLDEEESVFCYLDSASSRAGITTINEKLKMDRIAIVGLGGTGGYVLDLLAKTLVGEIHLFDGDSFLQHNAFRSPGAPSFEDLVKKPMKVIWFAENYSRMRRKIIP